jgi:Zn-dependent M16 (insulinase) family peptidase
VNAHAFALLREAEIVEIASLVRHYRHERTGAEFLSLVNDDDNKVFGITFVTPPEDSTGLPHIMEHSVLGGSRRYPVKEPFVELVKGSLQTFLNAMTAPDKTVYPVASQNVRDLRNLVDVYLDAVFHPRITRHTLLQEGWHYEIDENGDLALNGIVLNEMKGAYSSPDMVLYRRSLRSLFPDTPCGHDSGGDPAHIPDLTYERFRAFHETCYHPGNARIWWSGDDDPEERLRLLDRALAGFGPIETRPAIPLQPRAEAPRSVSVPYDAGEDASKCLISVNWLLGEVRDAEPALTDDILEHVLMGTPASPLRKALIDSGLGEDLTMGGLNASLRESTFSVGLKGVAEADAPEVEALILETLTTLARDGLDPATVEASVNTIEFLRRENNSGIYPRGLFMLMQTLPTWVHGGDPFSPLAFEAPLASIKARLAGRERVFEDRIRTGLLDNPHRTTVTLVPDADVRGDQEAAERGRLRAARAAMGEEDLVRVAGEAAELKRIQETPDSPEALATIPRLALEDLDRRGKDVPVEGRRAADVETLIHELPTAGIVYLDLGFDLHALPADLLPYASLFGRALLEMGTEGEDHVRLSQRIGRKTGGISPTTLTTATAGRSEAAVRLILRGKATVERCGDLLDILRDVLLTGRLDDRERFRQIVLEARARIETRLIPAGHEMAIRRVNARLHEAGWAAEQLDGAEQIFFLRRLADEIERDWPAVLARLEEVRGTLIRRSQAIANVTLDADATADFTDRLDGFLRSLPDGDAGHEPWTVLGGPDFEALTLPARGNYVAKGADLRALGCEPNGSVSVISNHLITSYLWERVRARGGAYASNCRFDRPSGQFGFYSYRDPHLLGTLETYDRAGAFLRELELGDEERVKSIIGAIGRIDAPLLPDGQGWRSLVRRLAGVTDEERQRRREEMLDAAVEDFRRFGDALDLVAEEGRVVVLGSPEAVAEARKERPEIEVVELL